MLKFLEKPSVTSTKDLASQVCPDSTYICSACRHAHSDLYELCSACSHYLSCSQAAKNKAAVKRKRESKPAKAARAAQPQEDEQADDDMGASWDGAHGIA